MSLLPFISDENLISEVTKVLNFDKTDSRENKSKRNSVDPFSAIFDASLQGIPINLWFTLEERRQSQKTLQNKLGLFHQNILGHIDGWNNLGKGNIVDVENPKSKIIAEVKNKFNTTKGSDKVRIYDNIEFLLTSKYKGYTGYYIEVIPRNQKSYNLEFTPSDNKTNIRKPGNSHIRVIDGSTFYDLATGHKNSLYMLYLTLPHVIGQVLNLPINSILGEKDVALLFSEVYKLK